MPRPGFFANQVAAPGGATSLGDMPTAVIAGASGLVGGHLLRELLAAPEYERVISVGRRRLGRDHPKLTEVVAEFTALDAVAGDLRADDAFCCLGTTRRRAGSREAFRAVDQTAVLAFAWAVQRAGARRFFTVSAQGASPESRFFYRRVKGETEEALRVLRFATLGILRPGLLLGARREFRLGEKLASAVLWLAEPLLVGRLEKHRPIEAATVARAMLRCSFGTGARGVLVFESDEIRDLGA